MPVAGLPPELARSNWRPTATERRKLEREKRHFEQVRRAERGYALRLRQVARNVGHLINGFTPGPEDLDELLRLLERYSVMIAPWAQATAARMIAEVTRRDAMAWFKVSRLIGVNLKAMIETAPVGQQIRGILDDQVGLITSLPTEAGRRVQKYTQDFVSGGKRYDELVDLVRDSGTVTVNRATLIARTETAKAQSAIVQARASYIGADRYYWRSARDSVVREAHKDLDRRSRAGESFAWDDPPVAEAGGDRHHPGQFPNCRCYAEPIIPEIIT